jgi:homoserine O-acetyltransferase
LKAARAIGVITYRNYGILVDKQTDPDPEKLDHYRASSYINYQGDKLVTRFNAYSYWLLTKSMDSHHLGRGRGGRPEKVLQKFKQKTLIIGITTDILCPLHEQEFLAEYIPNSKLLKIDSPYGHDGFITEAPKISKALREWL